MSVNKSSITPTLAPKTQFHWYYSTTTLTRNTHFSTFLHILASPVYDPGTIAANVTWIERELNAYFLLKYCNELHLLRYRTALIIIILKDTAVSWIITHFGLLFCSSQSSKRHALLCMTRPHSQQRITTELTADWHQLMVHGQSVLMNILRAANGHVTALYKAPFILYTTCAITNDLLDVWHSNSGTVRHPQ